MLYEIAHIIREKFGFLWEMVECVNGWLFTFRYRRKLKDINKLLAPLSSKYIVRQTTEMDGKSLTQFFNEQPEEAFEFFKPHKFDEKSIKRIIYNKAFQTFTVTDGDCILGYFFLRSFFNGKCFFGYIVDYSVRGKGIGKLMIKCAEKIAVYEGLRVFASVSPENVASLNSFNASSNIKIIKTLDNGYYYIEVTPRTTNDTKTTV